MNSPQYGIESMSGPGTKTLSWTLVFNRTYGLYAKNFWKYFRIALVPGIVAYLCGSFVHIVTQAAVRKFPLTHSSFLATALANGWLNGAVYWCISAFFLAAIAASFEGTADDDAPAVGDAYTLPRQRLGTILAVALLTWTLFWLGRILAGLAMFAFLSKANLLNHRGLVNGLYYLMLMLLVGLIAKFGVAIPELMHNLTLSAGNAMKRSLKLTEGWELFFIGLLIKSAIVGYGAYWITGIGLDWLWDHWRYNVDIVPWIERAIYISIGACLESPLFIACSVLSQELRSRPAAVQDAVLDRV
jgi:hypothetical protein